jgi:hypothetical protein
MMDTEFKFWTQATHYWNEKATFYHSLSDLENMNRCLMKAAGAMENRDEAVGLIFVVSGRAGLGLNASLGWKVNGNRVVA